MSVDRLDRVEARRVAIRAQLVDAHRPADLMAVVNHLTLLQLDPTAAVAPSADLVAAWTRLGAAYQPAHLQQAMERDRAVFEYLRGAATVRPMTDLGLYLAEMAAWPEEGSRHGEWLRANETFRRHVLDQLGESGRYCRATFRTVRTCHGLDRLDEQPQRHPDARGPRRTR